MIIIIMGVSGSGKTTVGTKLAKTLGWKFADGDDFHPQKNKDKIKKGIPLDDDDRQPWLENIRHEIEINLINNSNFIIVCSALKEKYRKMLLKDEEPVKLVYLKGSYELIEKRLIKREGHFANEDILPSQLDTLEEPSNAITIDISQTVESIIIEIIQNVALESSNFYLYIKYLKLFTRYKIKNFIYS